MTNKTYTRIIAEGLKQVMINEMSDEQLVRGLVGDFVYWREQGKSAEDATYETISNAVDELGNQTIKSIRAPRHEKLFKKYGKKEGLSPKEIDVLFNQK